MQRKPAELAHDQAAIEDASGAVLEARFYDLAVEYGRSGNWVKPGSPFSAERTMGLRGNFDLSRLRGSSKGLLLDFLAASVLLHCVDSWTYLGRALGALSTGSFAVAQHLLYYAELRSAMSLLARNGVFCIDGTNFVVDARGELEAVKKGGTHDAVWDYMGMWSQTPAAVRSVGGSIRMLDTTMSDWLEARHGLAGANLVVPELFDGWGVDLRLYGRDQRWRNFNSYVPQHQSEKPMRHSPDWIARALTETWRLIGSDGTASFGHLDSLLIRQGLRRSHEIFVGGDGAREVQFAKAVDGAISEIVSPPFRERARSVLLESKDALPDVLRYAAVRPSLRLPVDVATRGMLGRSLVLLRLATANVGGLIVDSGANRSMLERWSVDLFRRVGADRTGDSLDDLLDTQADVESALVEINEQPLGLSIADLISVSPQWVSEVHSLTKVERALVWSLVA